MHTPFPRETEQQGGRVCVCVCVCCVRVCVYTAYVKPACQCIHTHMLEDGKKTVTVTAPANSLHTLPLGSRTSLHVITLHTSRPKWQQCFYSLVVVVQKSPPPPPSCPKCILKDWPVVDVLIQRCLWRGGGGGGSELSAAVARDIHHRVPGCGTQEESEGEGEPLPR